MRPLEGAAVVRFGHVVAEARGTTEMWRGGTTCGLLHGLQVAGVCNDTAEARGMWHGGTRHGPLHGLRAAAVSDETAEACGAEVWHRGTTRGPAQRRALVAPHGTKQRRRCA